MLQSLPVSSSLYVFSSCNDNFHSRVVFWNRCSSSRSSAFFVRISGCVLCIPRESMMHIPWTEFGRFIANPPHILWLALAQTYCTHTHVHIYKCVYVYIVHIRHSPWIFSYVNELILPGSRRVEGSLPPFCVPAMCWRVYVHTYMMCRLEFGRTYTHTKQFWIFE